MHLNNYVSVFKDLFREASDGIEIPVYEGELLLLFCRLYLYGESFLISFLMIWMFDAIQSFILKVFLDVVKITDGLCSDKESVRLLFSINNRIDTLHFRKIGRRYTFKHHTFFSVSNYDADAQDLQFPLGRLGYTRPKVTDTGSMLATLTDIARINGYGFDADAFLKESLSHLKFEQSCFKIYLFEVLTICLIASASVQSELGKVDFLHHTIKN